jgi:hypothetical protein
MLDYRGSDPMPDQHRGLPFAFFDPLLKPDSAMSWLLSVPRLR